jgi:hypothetical protein
MTDAKTIRHFNGFFFIISLLCYTLTALSLENFTLRKQPNDLPKAFVYK